MHIYILPTMNRILLLAAVLVCKASKKDRSITEADERMTLVWHHVQNTVWPEIFEGSNFRGRPIFKDFTI